MGQYVLEGQRDCRYVINTKSILKILYYDLVKTAKQLIYTWLNLHCRKANSMLFMM